MSIRSGDRARANKQARKRRVQRQQSQILRRTLAATKPEDKPVSPDGATALKAEALV